MPLGVKVDPAASLQRTALGDDRFYTHVLGIGLAACGLSAQNAVPRTYEGSCLTIGGFKTPSGSSPGRAALQACRYWDRRV